MLLTSQAQNKLFLNIFNWVNETQKCSKCKWAVYSSPFPFYIRLELKWMDGALQLSQNISTFSTWTYTN